MSTLYERLESTEEGARGLAVARLQNEIMGAIAEALEAPNADRATRMAARVMLGDWENFRAAPHISKVAEIMHRLGKEIVIEVVPAGEPRRRVIAEMKKQATGREGCR